MLEIQRSIGQYEYVKATIDETNEDNVRAFEKIVDGLRAGKFKPSPEKKDEAGGDDLPF